MSHVQLRRCVDCVGGRRPPAVTARHAIVVLRIAGERASGQRGAVEP